MTRKKIERLVRTWQSRLGLDSWDIILDWTNPSPSENDADCWRSDDYDRAKLRFNADFSKWTDIFAERIVIHELLHVITRDIDRVIADLDGEIHRDVFTQTNRRYEHEIEGLVDRLSYRLMELVGT